MRENKKQLLKKYKQVDKEYCKCCNQLEQLNEYAFSLEKEMLYIETKLKFFGGD